MEIELAVLGHGATGVRLKRRDRNQHIILDENFNVIRHSNSICSQATGNFPNRYLAPKLEGNLR